MKFTFKERLYELLIENAREYAIFLTDPQGIIVDWNPGAERMFAYSSAEILGQPGAVIFTPEDRAAHIPEREMHKSMQDGQSTDDRWHMRKDGSRLFVTGYMFALKDEAGQLLGFGKIIRDRTEERRLQAELHRNEERLRIALATGQIGIWENDFLSAQMFWSDETKIILGLTPDAKESTDLFLSCVHPEDREFVHAGIQRGLQQPGEHDGQFRVVHPDDSVHYVAAKVKVSFNREGEQPYCDRAFGTLIDITERECRSQRLKQAIDDATRKLQEKILALETLSYAMAHHFRAPIRTVQGFGNVLENEFGTRLDDTGRDYLRRMVTAAEQMDSLVSDLLAYGGGAIRRLAEAPVDMNRTVVEVRESMREEIAASSAMVETSELRPVLGDAETVKTVLHALLSNSLKFTRPNVPPHIRLFAEQRGDKVRTWIEDNGIGIPSHQREKVFELFYRLDQNRIRAAGIGLALGKAMIERMHGTIGFESEVNKGTRFWFELPGVKEG